jgi:hypothetical protein
VVAEAIARIDAADDFVAEVRQIPRGGWIDTLKPSVAMGGYVNREGRLILAVHWPEG